MVSYAQPVQQKSNTIGTGLAMFSMFFGAGNVVFPLAIGQYAQGNNLYAILGLLITAVGVPFTGLMAMTLFDGNYKHFFERIGKVPGFLVTLFIMGLIGPFGAIPRCIALSYSTLQLYLPDLSLPLFSIISCVLIFICTFRKTKLLDILGYGLTPILLISLAVIVVKGFLESSPAPAVDHSKMATFLLGLNEGYQTMDLLGAFFFSSVVLICLKRDLPAGEHQNHKKMIFLTLKAGCIGMTLLTAVYVGFSYIAAFNSVDLANVEKEALLGTIAMKILGAQGSIVTVIAVALACLTTAIALAAVFSEFLHHDICKDKIDYRWSLVITLIITYFFSTLNFTGIVSFLAPILQVCYPALIALSLLNIAHKLYHFQPVKIPVLVVFCISLIAYFF